MNGIKYIFVIAILLSLYSCSKNNEEPIFNVIYQVDVFTSDSLKVEYNSDYFFSTKSYKPIFPLNSNNHTIIDGAIWQGERLTNNREEDYYIKVSNLIYTNPNNYSYGVRVYVNDTNLIDSYEINSAQAEIVLQGKISDKF